MEDHSRLLAAIARCEDPIQLRQQIKNARKQGNSIVADTAFRKLASLVPGEAPGSLEFSFWEAIQAFEEAKSESAGKKIRLGYTRRMVKTKGIAATLEGWALGKETDGFDTLMQLGMPELTGEAVILRHPDEFSDEVVRAAQDRLIGANVDLATVITRPNSPG